MRIVLKINLPSSNWATQYLLKKITITIIFLFSITKIFSQQYLCDTTFLIHKQTFKVSVKTTGNDSVLLTIYRNDTIIMAGALDGSMLGRFTFPDFNKDGYPDIITTYTGNNFSYSLFLFDKFNNNFRSIEGFEKFPDAISIKLSHQYYYSYHRGGCADDNWVSDLFIIKNFKAIHLGKIYGQGCEYEIDKNPQVIKIYKIINNDDAKRKLIQKLPYLKYVGGSGDKWQFIEKYWNSKWQQFK